MVTKWRSAALGLVLTAFATSTALAEGVRIVTPAGNLNFTTIQTAIDAASDGDVLLIAQGNYSGFTIDGKSISIYAVPGAVVEIYGLAAIRNLATGQVVLLHGLEFTGYAWSCCAVLSVETCEGFVRLQECTVLGGSLGLGFACDPSHGGVGVRVVDSPHVALLECSLQGTEGQIQDGFVLCYGGNGGSGLHALRSTVALYECVIRGGWGGAALGDPGSGGLGIEAQDSVLYASGGEVHGGRGGVTYYTYMTGVGDAAWLSAGSILDSVALNLFGGMVGRGLVTGPGLYNPLPTSARTLDVASIVPAGSPIYANYAGEADDLVWLAASVAPAHEWQPAFWGVSLTRFPVFVPTKPLGSASSSGLANFKLPFGSTPPGMTHRQFVFQGLVLASWGHRFLSDASHVLVLSPTVGPDCNGNGTSDYLDVILGTSPDTNHNLVPDECDP